MDIKMEDILKELQEIKNELKEIRETMPAFGIHCGKAIAFFNEDGECLSEAYFEYVRSLKKEKECCKKEGQ